MYCAQFWLNNIPYFITHPRLLSLSLSESDSSLSYLLHCDPCGEDIWFRVLLIVLLARSDRISFVAKLVTSSRSESLNMSAMKCYLRCSNVYEQQPLSNLTLLIEAYMHAQINLNLSRFFRQVLSLMTML